MIQEILTSIPVLIILALYNALCICFYAGLFYRSNLSAKFRNFLADKISNEKLNLLEGIFEWFALLVIACLLFFFLAPAFSMLVALAFSAIFIIESRIYHKRFA